MSQGPALVATAAQASQPVDGEAVTDLLGEYPGACEQQAHRGASGGAGRLAPAGSGGARGRPPRLAGTQPPGSSHDYGRGEDARSRHGQFLDVGKRLADDPGVRGADGRDGGAGAGQEHGQHLDAAEAFVQPAPATRYQEPPAGVAQGGHHRHRRRCQCGRFAYPGDSAERDRQHPQRPFGQDDEEPQAAVAEPDVHALALFQGRRGGIEHARDECE